MGDRVHVIELCNEALARNAAFTSDIIDLRHLRVIGQFALHLIFSSSGSATLTATYTVAPIEEGTFLTPAAAVDIGTTLAKGSHHVAFSPILTPFLKIVLTEDNVATITNLRAWLIHQ